MDATFLVTEFLGLLKIVIWPAVVIYVARKFDPELRRLIDRIKGLKGVEFFGSTQSVSQLETDGVVSVPQ